MPLAVGAFHPAIAVAVVLKAVRTLRLELPAEPILQLFLEPIHAAIENGVFQPSVLAIGAVAEVALRGEDLLGHVQHLIGQAEAQHPAQIGERGRLAVRHAQAAARGDVEAGQTSVLGDGDKPKIVGKHVDVIAGRNGYRDFEFPRQVGRPVHGFCVFRVRVLGRRHDGLVANPDFVIRSSPRGQVLAQPLGPFIDLAVDFGYVRVGVAHHVAVHVAASGQRVQQRLVDVVDRLAKVPLGHAVELERLPRGKAELPAGVLMGEGVQIEPLPRRDDAAGSADADHEVEGRLQPLPRPFLADVAVVLHVRAVELQQGIVAFRHRAGNAIAKRLQDRAAEKVAGRLDAFVLGQLLCGGALVTVSGMEVFSLWMRRTVAVQS